MTSWVPRFGTSGKPRYLEIADAIERDASSGVLTAGAQLPPQRRLADVLGLDFTTISRAYTEAQSRGLVESHVGRGTFVRARPGAVGPVADPRRAREQDLAMNLPPEPEDPALLAAMRQGLETVSANLVALLRYQSTVGSEMDRSAALSWLSMRGMVPNLDRIAVTPGAHATMMAVLQTLAAPGDTILCEAITYPGIRAIAARAGLELIGLPSDGAGILPDALADGIKTHRPKALYLNPTLHNPTTLTIPAARRMEIAETLRRYRLPLIEDDAYGFVQPNAPAPFATLLPELTWHITGLAKCIGAGLRLAFTIAPDSRSAFQLAQTLRVANVMASPIAMALVTRWIEDGTADRICRFIRAESAARQDIAGRLLQGFEFASDRHAFNLWLKLPEGIGRAEVMGRMNGRGIGLMPSDAFTVSGAPDDHLRICLGGPITREGLHSGLSFLGNSLNEGTWIG
ncbi:PLP-dependent aminotransferase family protein [Pseudorhodobacter sp. MZDSW-24AT]|uniref:aminotransferase-like domain-containing protein n=1 Tax=Pseudorhodobacter sp. MZDSW-24AT TaxID=2052957 RepID=UPI000C1EF37A|nr:PLP-dependent aminotransferase family protein [Pseudorhodobacter sp. MZDSW-24AT]PJF08064.1 GntR family transcriptional regulator [Pseudorhodobacter sp. MZDSW-24AT]